MIGSWKFECGSGILIPIYHGLRLARSGGGAYSVCTENFIDHATNEEVASWCKVYTATIPMTSGTTDAREAFDLDFTGTTKSLWTSQIVVEDCL